VLIAQNSNIQTPGVEPANTLAGHKLANNRLQRIPPGRRVAMLHYAIVFFVIAIIAAVFGFTGIAAGAAEIAKILFYIFLVVFVVTLLLGVIRT
jgi:uncharacterized membrane protein YtjA (UPF0391 family)